MLLNGAVMYMNMSLSSCSMQQQAMKMDNTTDDLFKVTRNHSNCECKIKFISTIIKTILNFSMLCHSVEEHY